MKEFSLKKFLAMLVALFVLGACSTTEESNTDTTTPEGETTLPEGNTDGETEGETEDDEESEV